MTHKTGPCEQPLAVVHVARIPGCSISRDGSICRRVERLSPLPLDSVHQCSNLLIRKRSSLAPRPGGHLRTGPSILDHMPELIFRNQLQIKWIVELPARRFFSFVPVTTGTVLAV